MKLVAGLLLMPLLGLWLVQSSLPPEIGSWLGDVVEATSTSLGLFLGYASCILSGYAIWEVRRLSDRYFAKQRLPQLGKQAVVIVGKMDELKEVQLIEVRSSTFLGEIRVLVKQLEKTKSPGFPEVVKRVGTLCKQLDKLVKNCANLDQKLNDVPQFWDLYSAVSQVSDEIKAYQEEAKASL